MNREQGLTHLHAIDHGERGGGGGYGGGRRAALILPILSGFAVISVTAKELIYTRIARASKLFCAVAPITEMSRLQTPQAEWFWERFTGKVVKLSFAIFLISLESTIN